jgi:hypothetical protein
LAESEHLAALLMRLGVIVEGIHLAGTIADLVAPVRAAAQACGQRVWLA